jgi:hypothetical protein
MDRGTGIAVGAFVIAIIALGGTVATYALGNTHAGPSGASGTQGPQGPPGAGGAPGAKGAPGTNGQNGSQGPPGDQGPPGTQGPPGRNGSNGSDGTNGTNGTNATSYVAQYYQFAPTFNATGNLTFLNVTYLGCSARGSGLYECDINVSNTCNPSDAPRAMAVHPEWACHSWFYALKNLTMTSNDSYYVGSNGDVGHALGWGQNETVELWFQTAVFKLVPSGVPEAIAPTLTPTIVLGFGKVSE